MQKIYSAHLETFKEERETVGAVDATFLSRLGAGWTLSSHLQRSSQDTFLRRYRYDSEQTLKSHITATKMTNDRFYRVSMSDVQGLRETDTPDKEATILPSVFYAKTSPGPLRTRLLDKNLAPSN